nr:unnamed protein product [Digitaria exilis]
MGFSEAVQWWEEWQVRVLVLGSLFLQYFLYFAAPLRKRSIPSWFRFTIWLAYLGSDALAIYALAALFNRHKKTLSKNASLEALWAPILLVHLGILKCIAKPVALKNASINTLMSIVRSRSCPDTGVPPDDNTTPVDPDQEEFNKEILDVFVKDEVYYPFVDMAPGRSVGGYEHDDLRTALSVSFDRLYTKEQVYSHTMKFILFMYFSNRVPWKRICGFLLRILVNPMIFTALGLFHTSHRRDYNSVDVKVTYTLLACTASLQYFGGFWLSVGHCVCGVYNIFANGRMPTHSPWPDDVAQYSLIGYLASKRKHKTLTSITAFLGCEDYLDPLWCMKPFNWAMFITWLVTRFVETWKPDHGSEGGRAFNDNRGHWTLKRHGCGGSNILRESLRRPFDESVLVWHLATEFCCFDRMDNIPDNDDDALYHLATCYFAHLDALWSKNKNKNTGSNDDAGDDNTGDDNTGGNDDGEDNNTGGNDAGSNNTGDDNTGGNDAGNNNTGDDNTGGNNADVDNTGGNSTGDDDSIDNDALANVRISCVISNYMAYLLFVNPEMLMTGARPSLFRNAYKRLNGMLLDDGEERTAALTEKDLAQKIIQELKGGAKGRGIIDDAWALSQELTKLCNDDNDKMWKVIFGVWVEMLCFSASRCRGYLHAKSLGKGGEYLSYIWLAPVAHGDGNLVRQDAEGTGSARATRRRW